MKRPDLERPDLEAIGIRYGPWAEDLENCGEWSAGSIGLLYGDVYRLLAYARHLEEELKRDEEGSLYLASIVREQGCKIMDLEEENKRLRDQKWGSEEAWKVMKERMAKTPGYEAPE